jgi:hypothetical protein
MRKRDQCKEREGDKCIKRQSSVKREKRSGEREVRSVKRRREVERERREVD